MTNDIVTIEQDSPYAIMPVMDFQAAAMRRQAVIDFYKTLMHKGTDYGVIPGTGTKPTLLKPGAEKLASLFGLSPRFEIIERIMDWTGRDYDGEPFFFFHYRCTLVRGEIVVGQGMGSCNSFERKYRYRKGERVCPNCGAAAIIKGKLEYGGGWLCFNKKGGCGSKFNDGDPAIENQEVGQVKNPDPADVVNTIDKMSQKRALVAAVLIAVNASELFTQDIEDYSDIVDGAWEVEKPAPPKPQPVKKAPDAPPPTVSTVDNAVAAFVRRVETMPGPQAVGFVNGRLTDWINYVTDDNYDPAHAELLVTVLNDYCSAVADNGNTHSKATAESARAVYRENIAAAAGAQDGLFTDAEDGAPVEAGAYQEN